ncbi:MAG: hypothetical protein ACRENE_19100 [Polyangiaceae bacterium]
MSNTKDTKKLLLARVDDLIAGTTKHPPGGSLTLGNASFTAASLGQGLEVLSHAIAAADAAKAGWQDALEKMNAARSEWIPVVRDYTAWVKVTYRSAPSMLADFGVAPPKARTPLTVDQQAAAVAKGKATRSARHTMGKVQKKKVKGTVAVAAPVTQSSTAAAPVVQSGAAGSPATGAGGGATPHTT